MPRSVSTDGKTNVCSYCQLNLDDDNYLECEKCDKNVHIKCLPLESTPGDLLGDVFFDFTCIKCVREESTRDGLTEGAVKEKFVRQHVPWVLVITLAIYNLSIRSKGLSHHGCFHWRTHIISFIEKHWNFIFEPRVRRRKHWIGSVSGALSLNNPEIFHSGANVALEEGWWKLAKPNFTPRSVRTLYERRLQDRQQQRIARPVNDENSCDSELSVTDHHSEAPAPNPIQAEEYPERAIHPGGGCARTIPYMGRLPKVSGQIDIGAPKVQENPQQESAVEDTTSVQASLMDFLAESLGGDNLNMFMPPPLIGASGKGDFFMTEALLEAPVNTSGLFELETNFSLPPIDNDSTYHKIASKDDSMTLQGPQEETKSYSSNSESEGEDTIETEKPTGEDVNYQPRIVQVTNYQAQEQRTTKVKIELADALEDNEDMEVEPTKINSTFPFARCKPSGFTRQPRRNWPWLQEAEQEQESQTEAAQNLKLMSIYEEQQLHQQLHRIFSLEQHSNSDIPAYVRRFYRKLCLRKWKREHNRPIFNLDEHIDPTARSRLLLAKQHQTQILDRYQLLELGSQDIRSSFYARIVGISEYELFESPYTKRVLQPFIYRNKKMAPPWLRLMCELQHRVNRSYPSRSTIDFCYVRPQHIPAVNALLQSVFWPGIDVSECLSYPDYSVVALYKKLVVGCGFLVPDVGFNEAYISFMAVRQNWQRSGIASFMLYHLIQTCMSKDITLHVSASNSAVMLYQKFGFKIEEVILDFYDKYLPLDSKQSRNAFFLRLLR